MTTPVCGLCGDLPATVLDRWPEPVCDECDDWLLEAEDDQLSFDDLQERWDNPTVDVQVDPRYL